MWKVSDIETRLSNMEKEGWRLERIHGLYCFEFTKSTPKEVQYFFNYSLGREHGMMNTEQALKSEGANKVNGDFLSFLVNTSVYRITKKTDLKDRDDFRNSYLHHIYFYKMILCLFMFCLFLIPLFMQIFYHGFASTFSFEWLIVELIVVLFVALTVFNFIGLIKIKRKYNA